MWILALSTAMAQSLTAEGYLQAVPEGMAPGVGLKVAPGSLFVEGEARSMGPGTFIGRATGGFDLFASDELDLTLGVFAGSVGTTTVPSVQQTAPSAGLAFSVGGRLGPVHLRYRHLDGFRGPLEDRLTENEARVGVFLADDFEVFGQFVDFRPDLEDEPGMQGYGLGLAFNL